MTVPVPAPPPVHAPVPPVPPVAEVPQVAAALRALGGLGQRPVHEHVELFDGLHRALQDALANLDEA